MQTQALSQGWFPEKNTLKVTVMHSGEQAVSVPSAEHEDPAPDWQEENRAKLQSSALQTMWRRTCTD